MTDHDIHPEPGPTPRERALIARNRELEAEVKGLERTLASLKYRAEISNQMRDFANWLESEEGLDMIKDKGLDRSGIRRAAILSMLHEQFDDGGNHTDCELLKSVVLGYYFEIPPDRRPPLETLMKHALSDPDK